MIHSRQQTRRRSTNPSAIRLAVLGIGLIIVSGCSTLGTNLLVTQEFLTNQDSSLRRVPQTDRDRRTSEDEMTAVVLSPMASLRQVPHKSTSGAAIQNSTSSANPGAYARQDLNGAAHYAMRPPEVQPSSLQRVPAQPKKVINQNLMGAASQAMRQPEVQPAILYEAPVKHPEVIQQVRYNVPPIVRAEVRPAIRVENRTDPRDTIATARTSVTESINRTPSFNWQQGISHARGLEADGKKSEAIAAYQKMLQIPGAPAIAFHRLAVLYDQTNQPQVALPLYQAAMTLTPNNAELLCDYGFRCDLLGDRETAIRYYQRSLEVGPKHQRTHNHLAVALTKNNQLKVAETHFRLAGLSRAQIKENIKMLQSP